jgi:hypothetical protein
MWGYNSNNNPIFSRAQDPLMKLPFSQWWFHGHLNDPPAKNEAVEFPAGGSTVMQIACDAGATKYWHVNKNGNSADPNNPNTPCPRKETKVFHANNIEDVNGCALAVAYKNVVADVVPEDFTVFTVNHTCVWELNTVFIVPKNMPACPIQKETGLEQCICAFSWTHKQDSGAAQSWFLLSNPERDPGH